jgi:hypothetical protein
MSSILGCKEEPSSVDVSEVPITIKSSNFFYEDDIEKPNKSIPCDKSKRQKIILSAKNSLDGNLIDNAKIKAIDTDNPDSEAISFSWNESSLTYNIV